MSESRDKTFCPRPWKRWLVRGDGTYHACCLPTDVSQTVLKNENGEASHASREGFLSVFNSPTLREIRKEMLNGEKPKACNLCWEAEALGVQSARQNDLNHDPFTLAKAKEITKDDGAIAIPQELTLDLRLGRSCNLKCRMCGPMSSHLWDEDYRHLHGKDYYSQPPQDWSQSEVFWKDLEKISANVKKIMFAGGEPLLIPEHKKFLKQVIAAGRASQIDLQYSTNVTLLKPEDFDVWNHFRSVHLGLSLEAVGSANDYIRSPSKWSDVEAKLALLEERGGVVRGAIQPTLNIYNVATMVDFAEWYLTKNFRHIDWTPILNLQEEPAWQSFHLLPQATREELRLELQAFFDEKLKNEKLRVQNLKKYIQELCFALVQPRKTTSKLEDFLRMNQQLDEKRGQSLPASLPKLWTLLQEVAP